MAASLHYPIEEEPQTGRLRNRNSARRVVVRMLYSQASWINVWAIAEEGGWTIIDTGSLCKTIDAWRPVCRPLGGAPFWRVVVTHMHPDHCGMAGWMTERFNAPLCMSRLEYLTCVDGRDTGRQAPERHSVLFALRLGRSSIEGTKKDSFVGRMIYPLPPPIGYLDGDLLRLGAHEWTVAVAMDILDTRVCIVRVKAFYFRGQVCAHFIERFGASRNRKHPLSDWLDSLAMIVRRIRAMAGIAAHNSPFKGLHARARELTNRRAAWRDSRIAYRTRRH